MITALTLLYTKQRHAKLRINNKYTLILPEKTTEIEVIHNTAEILF